MLGEISKVPAFMESTCSGGDREKQVSQKKNLILIHKFIYDLYIFSLYVNDVQPHLFT